MQWILLLLVIKSCSVGVCALAGSVPVETEPPQVSDPQEAVGHNRPSWQIYRGKPGPTGWRCHVIWPDPKDHGPDGINIHDWDNDGHLDVFVNYEEGHYSRLLFQSR